MSVRINDYHSDVENAWCPGCGNFAILNAVKKALVGLDLLPHQVVICTGIGQAPKLPHYMRVNTFNGLHGREVAAATAIKLTNKDLTVLVHAGDGGAYAEGGNHLLHAIRRNIDLTLVVHDNKVYALTKGQASPTTALGTVTNLQASGSLAEPINPLALAISQNCGYVAQATSAKPDQLVALFTAAIQHKGFSLVNVLQPCVTWDKVHTFQYYSKHCYQVGPDHDPTNIHHAFRLVTAQQDKIPTGIIYQNQRNPYDSLATSGIQTPMHKLGVDPQAAEALYQQFR